MRLRCIPGLAAVVLVAVTAAVASDSGIGSSTRADEDGCTAEATTALIQTFVRDYGRGRVAAIARLWAPEPRFQWFSASGAHARLGSRAYDRSTLAAYFRARVRLHERIRVIEVGAGYDAARDLVHFSGKLVRRADDLPRRPPHDFKGAADCESGRPSLIVWSM